MKNYHRNCSNEEKLRLLKKQPAWYLKLLLDQEGNKDKKEDFIKNNFDELWDVFFDELTSI